MENSGMASRTADKSRGTRASARQTLRVWGVAKGPQRVTMDKEKLKRHVEQIKAAMKEHREFLESARQTAKRVVEDSQELSEISKELATASSDKD